jgi:alanine or glycine:cation symporter, AGCS family
MLILNNKMIKIFKYSILSIITVIFSGLSTYAQVENSESIDDQINGTLGPIAQKISDIIFFEIPISESVGLPFILIWLMGGAIFFTFYLKFINIRGFKHAIDIIKGKYTNSNDPGEVTHFQALTAALSGTVGLGNIAGVAIAISLGGPGATFWMIIAGFLGMSSKFVECALGVKYRDVNPDGTVSGGPMYYLKKGLAERGYGKLGAVLAVLFCIGCIGGAFGAGCMFQVNQAAQQFFSVTGSFGEWLSQSAWIFGLVMAGLVGIVIIGGIKSIASVTEKIVPFMCGIYIIGALVVILTNYSLIPGALMSIIRGAFDGTAIAGGLVGVLIQGIRRAAFSNEAGIGSAAIAHSAVKTSIPITEGFVASLEPFVDTVVVCTMTALVIIITGAYQIDAAGDGIALTSTAFSTVITWFPYVLSVAVLLFAFSTIISWSYYGLKSWTFMFGESKFSDYSYKLVFCFFIIAGASMPLGNIVAFSDAMLFSSAFPNFIGLYIMAPSVKRDIQLFLNMVKTGEIFEKQADIEEMPKEKVSI